MSTNHAHVLLLPVHREGEEFRCLGACTRAKKILIVAVQVGSCMQPISKAATDKGGM